MPRHDYSLPERALAFWYPLTLGILAVTSLGLRYVTNPITCWAPAHFTDSAVKYAHDVCFQAKEIYPVTSSEVPPAQDDVPKTNHTYHQWVPFALGIAAILCLIPHVIWRMLSGLLWMDTHTLAQTLADNQRHNAATRHVMLKDSALVVQAGLRGGNWMLTAAALGRKMAVCLVCVLQLVLVVVLFQPKLSAEGKAEEKQVEQQIPEVRNRSFSKTVPLPEHSFICYYEVRMIQNVHQYSIQCTMPVAQVYSKAFTFLFYLFLLLAVCCVLDLLTFLTRLAIPGLRDASLRRYLALTDPAADPQLSDPVLQRFLDSLGVDGRLVVAVTADVCGPVAAADLTHHLWMTFKASPRPGPLPADPAHGPAPAGHVSTIPPPAAAATVPPGPSAHPDTYPLLPMGDSGKQMTGAEA